MSENRYQIWAGGKLAPHQDIATLFYTRCAELYAKPGARICMVPTIDASFTAPEMALVRVEPSGAYVNVERFEPC